MRSAAMTLLGLLVATVLVLQAGCQRELEQDALFTCTSDLDCLPGYVCRNPYANPAAHPNSTTVCWKQGDPPIMETLDASTGPDTTSSTDASSPSDSPETTSGDTATSDLPDASDMATCPACADGAECIAGECRCSGSGGQVCPAALPGAASAMCSGMTCRTTCALAAGDCDADASNGCEVDLDTSSEHCGACGSGCGGGGSCSAGACDPIEEIALGDAHSCALRSDSSVVCWGLDDYGQVSGGSSGQAQDPRLVGEVSVGGGSPGGRLGLGIATSCAIDGSSSDGVVCWGLDGLDDAPRTGFEVTFGVPASGGGSAAGVSVGEAHVCAWTTDGEVYCWGDNEFGQLAQPLATGQSPTAQKVTIPGDPAIASVASGRLFSCARSDLGEVYCWGRNDNCQLGADGVSGPIAVDLGGGSASALSAGAFHACAIVEGGAAGPDRRVLCWGSSGDQRTGPDASGACSTSGTTPVPVTAGCTPVDIVAGRIHSCVACDNGSVECWGGNGAGQLGDGTSAPSGDPVAVQLPAGASISVLASGSDHVCGWDETTSQLLCWGEGASKRLGVDLAGSSTPVVVMR